MDTGHYFADIAAIQADKAFGLTAGDTDLAAATDIELVVVSIELVVAATNIGTAVAENIVAKLHIGRLEKYSHNTLAFHSGI